MEDKGRWSEDLETFEKRAKAYGVGDLDSAKAYLEAMREKNWEGKPITIYYAMQALDRNGGRLDINDNDRRVILDKLLRGEIANNGSTMYEIILENASDRENLTREVLKRHIDYLKTDDGRRDDVSIGNEAIIYLLGQLPEQQRAEMLEAFNERKLDRIVIEHGNITEDELKRMAEGRCGFKDLQEVGEAIKIARDIKRDKRIGAEKEMAEQQAFNEATIGEER